MQKRSSSKALEKRTEVERAAYLDQACAGNAELRRQVERLLNAYPRAETFLHKPIVEQLAEALETLQATPNAVDEGTDDDDESRLDFLQPPTRRDALGRIGHYEVFELLGQVEPPLVPHAASPATVHSMSTRDRATGAGRPNLLREFLERRVTPGRPRN